MVDLFFIPPPSSFSVKKLYADLTAISEITRIINGFLRGVCASEGFTVERKVLSSRLMVADDQKFFYLQHLFKRRLNESVLVWFSFLSWVVVVSACLLSGAQRLRASERIGFIGDGYSLGAGAKGEFDYTPGSLVKTLDRSYTTAPSSMVAPNLAQMGIREWLPPQVLWPSLREKKDPFWWVVQHFLHGVYSEFFNTPEYGWSSLLAGSLGYDAQGVHCS